MTEVTADPQAPAFDVRSVLAAAFAQAIGSDGVSRAAFEAISRRLTVAMEQLDCLRKVSTTPELPTWLYMNNALVIADVVSAEIGILASALRDAQQKSAPQPTAQMH